MKRPLNSGLFLECRPKLNPLGKGKGLTLHQYLPNDGVPTQSLGGKARLLRAFIIKNNSWRLNLQLCAI